MGRFFFCSVYILFNFTNRISHIIYQISDILYEISHMLYKIYNIVYYLSDNLN